MKRFGILFLAVLMMFCAVFGSFNPTARIAMAEPTLAEQSQGDTSETESGSAGTEATPPPAVEEKENATPVPTPEASVEAEPTPAEADGAEPTPEATDGAEPTPEATDGADPTPEATDGAEPTPEATDGAEVTPLPTEELTPTPAPTKMIIEGSGPAWIAIKGGRRYGELIELIPISDDTIYISSKDVLALTGYTVEALKAVSFEPDREIFEAKSDIVIISDLDPNGNARENTVFIWVGNPSSIPSATESPISNFELSDEEPSDIEIQVIKLPNDASLPTFMLTCVPALLDGQSFAVIEGDGAPEAIQGDSYTPAAPCELRFAVLSADGNVLSKSAKYIAELSLIQAAEENAPAGEAPGDQTETSDALPAELNEIHGSLLNTLIEEIGDAAEEESSEKAAEQEGDMSAASVEIEISVTAIDYFPGEVSDVAPVFILSGLPSSGKYRYAVMINGDDPVALGGNTYTWAQEGSYILRFVIIDQKGNIAAMSGKYTLDLDFSATESKKQAWMTDPNSGNKVYGTLAGLLTRAGSGGTIYISVSETITLGGGRGLLSGITLVPDPDLFAAGAYTVKVSTDQTGDLNVQVVRKSGSGGSTEKFDLTASADNYFPGVWVNGYPVFAIHCAPDKADGYEYAVIIDGGTPIVLSSNVFTADIEGKHLFTFALLDEDMQIAAQSPNYEVLIDITAPIMRVETASLTLTVTVTDALSDVLYVSLDAGATWNEATVQKDGSLGYQYTAAAAQAFAAGTIQAKDAAGNVATYEQAVALTGMSGMGGYGGYGGSGGGSSRTVSHSSADDSSTTAYNAVDLSADETEMSELTLGGETLDLTIERVSLEGSGGEMATFTAALAAWGTSEEDGYDSLVLSAVTDGEEADEYAFLWDFSGTVYKKLAASGIDYLILRVDDHLTAISTAGFTAGNRYNLLKSRGVSSKEFRYSVLMGVPQPELEMEVSVDGGTYPLSDDNANEMYYYDVYPGGPDMMDRTFGA